MAVEFLPETKVCYNCKQRKPKSKFHLRHDRRENRSGLASQCIECYTKMWAANRRSTKLQHRYGIIEAEYTIILNAQNNVCALCGKPEVRKSNDKIVDRFAVDHNHKTFKIRGLLCFQCNTILGKIEKLPGGIHSIIKYLKKGG